MNVKSSWCNGWNNFLLVLRDSMSDPQSVHYAYSIARAGRERGCEMLGIKRKSHYLSIKVINCASQLATSDKFTKFQFCCPTTHTASFHASSHLWELISIIWRVVKETDLAVNTKNQELRKQDRTELVHSTSNASGKKTKGLVFPLGETEIKMLSSNTNLQWDFSLPPTNLCGHRGMPQTFPVSIPCSFSEKIQGHEAMRSADGKILVEANVSNVSNQDETWLLCSTGKFSQGRWNGFSKHNWSGTARAESNDRAFSKLELVRYVPTGDL